MHVVSFAEEPRSLFEHLDWELSGSHSRAAVLEWRAHGNGFVVKLEGVETRERAAQLTGELITVPRDALAPTGDREHYRADLVGLAVRNSEGVEFGIVDHFVDAPGNAVMVVKGDRERWVPVTPRHLLKVDAAAGYLVVDWPADF